MKTYREFVSEALSAEQKDVRITVEKGGAVVGRAYLMGDRWVAELDKSISNRSQSFTSLELAVQALIDYQRGE